MPLPMLPAAPVSETSTAGSFLEAFIHEALPTFALWAGLMAVIWIACAAITLAGASIGIVVVTAIQDMTQAFSRYFRCRSEVEDDQFVTADTDEAQATITDLDHYRQRRHSGDPDSTKHGDRRPDDSA